jgi:glycosyltransferase involved in cell wall biosynthesis
MEKKLVLFTSHFPYSGGETFLHHEFPALCSVFEEVIVVPAIQPAENDKPVLPNNVTVHPGWEIQQVPFRKIILNYGWLILKWFVTEIIKSPHRKRYFTEFKWNWNRLIGLIIEAENIPKGWNQKNMVLYSYWLNDWATILAILKDKGWVNKIIGRAHGYDFDEGQQSRGYHPFRYTEISRWSRIFQISQYGLDYMKKRHGNHLSVELSYLGVNVQDSAAPVPTDKKVTIVSCSHFYPVKRVQLIPEILKNLNVDFHWIHFGESIGMDEVVTRTAELLPQDKYEYRGWTENAALMHFYRTTPVDLFINVSELEGIPVAIMEAASFGIPAAACKVCGIPEIINQGSGILLDVDFNPKDAAATIEKYLHSKSRDLVLREKIRSDFGSKFNAKENYKTFANKLIA